MKHIESFLEGFIFNSRWILAPFYLGLVVAIAALLVLFLEHLYLDIILKIMRHEINHSALTMQILELVDMSLVANLLLIIIFSGYENFVSKINTADHEDRPEWMGKVDFSGLKVKLIASIVAISAIELLKAFVQIEMPTAQAVEAAKQAGTALKHPSIPWDSALGWKVIIHLVLVVSGVLFAIMDKISSHTYAASHGGGDQDKH